MILPVILPTPAFGQIIHRIVLPIIAITNEIRSTKESQMSIKLICTIQHSYENYETDCLSSTSSATTIKKTKILLLFSPLKSRR